MQRAWYGSNKGTEAKQCAVAVSDAGIGREINREDAKSGDFMIFPRKESTRAAMVVRGEVLQPDDGSAICRYEILSPAITDRMALCLMRDCVLSGLLDLDLTDRDLSIRFERRPPCDPT